MIVGDVTKPGQTYHRKCSKKKCVGTAVMKLGIVDSWFVGFCGKCKTKHIEKKGKKK